MVVEGYLPSISVDMHKDDYALLLDFFSTFSSDGEMTMTTIAVTTSQGLLIHL